ncbi:MAG: DNA polymerase III subunit delta' [Nitrosomonas sp.]|nr:MAG: DNA polymerase III subunit delta' [Nitrosomonas sp.]
MAERYTWQQTVWRKLSQKQLLRGHAILLQGRQGIGKYDFARYWAKSRLCDSPTAIQEACGACLSCRWFESDAHPNFRTIVPEALTDDIVTEASIDGDKSGQAAQKKNAGRQISIDQIRRLDSFIYLSGHQRNDKIVILYPAEAMNTAAANALLKKLEEPPEEVLIILVTHQPQRLLPTIRSRCQPIAMPMPNRESAAAWLRQHAVERPEPVLAAAGFAPLVALRMAQTGQVAQYVQLMQQLAQPKRLNPLTLADGLQPIGLPVVVDWLQKWCYDLISYRTCGRIRYSPDEAAAIRAVSKRLDIDGCIRFVRELHQKRRLSQHPLNSRLFIEELLITYQALIEP